jgi:3-deoxy-D-manno-octulosonic acid kinase
MKKTITIQYNDYCFGTASNLTNLHFKKLIHLFQQPSKPESSILGGRTSIIETCLEPIGDVVIKQYKRGGLVRFFIKETYLKLGNVRCKIEYEQLNHARQLGINAPKPIAYAYKGGSFYKGWLVTEKIHNQQTLVKLAMADLPKAEKASMKLLDQISKMIDNRIFHKDLHPGNVLVTDTDKIYIIDFDKACIFNGSKQQLTSRYIKRWKRSISKYQLPDILSEILEKGIGSR